MPSDRNALAARVAAALSPIAAIRVAYLFGSRAYGAPHAESDLDVGIAYLPALSAADRETARREALAALTDTLGALGERADIVDIERAFSAVGFRAIRDGVRLLARSERDRVAVEAWVARRHDDESPRRAILRRGAIAAAKRMRSTPHGRP